MRSLVSVTVVNWNGQRYLAQCLASLFAQTYPCYEIILVDNGSTDGSAEWARQQFPDLRLVQNDGNLGFAVANNQGIAVSRGAYVALLNNDAWVEPEWLDTVVAAIEQDERIGMVASKMVYADQPDTINSTGICIDRAGVVWDRDSGRPDGSPGSGAPEVFGPCAGAALYRRELFDDVGGLDGEFFAYMEDVDLAWRARWRGWRAVYAPGTQVYHWHSATSVEGSPWKTFLLARNKLRLLIKNYPAPHWVVYLPLIVGYEVLSWFWAIGRGCGLPATRGRLAALRSLPGTLRLRRAMPRATSAAEVFRHLEPVTWPWQVYARYRHLVWRSPGG